ncbi:ZIP family metal transporter [Streptomyces cyaneofuscatus]|uniref:ZIP family metal transporter n=1 Tax=Streptomyces cyaneofuscatus TaxID=66883 RepID=UPI003658E381
MAVFLAFCAALMTVFGGWVARKVSDRRHLVLGLAGGLMLGVVGFDLLPEALAATGADLFGVPAALLLFIAGFLGAHCLEKILADHQLMHGSLKEGQRSPQMGIAAAAGMVGHSAIDGVAIGGALQLGGSVATTVAIAVVAHDFADGFNTYTITRIYGNQRRKALRMLALDSLAPVVGASSTMLFEIPKGILGGYLGFFAGVLLYISATQILPEAHHHHPARLTLLCTIVGVLFIFFVMGVAN